MLRLLKLFYEKSSMDIDNIIFKVGEIVFYKIEKSNNIQDCKKIDNIPSDKVINITIKNITYNLMMLSFVIGLIAVVPSLIFTEYFKDILEPFDYYFTLLLIISISTLFELIILYGFTLYSTYTIALLLGYDNIKEKRIAGISIKDILINLSLELDEPIFTYMDIDPLKYRPKIFILLSTFIYKLKIILSSFIVKLIVKKISTRIGIKIYIGIIDAIINAIWDMVTTYLIIRDIKYRIFAYYIGEYTFEHILTQKHIKRYFSNDLKEALFRIISILVVNSNHKSFNNTLFLAKFRNHIQITDNLEDIDIFLGIFDKLSDKERDIVKIISALQVAIDGNVNRKEIKTLLKFATKEDIDFANEISQLLKTNRVNKIVELIQQRVNSVIFS